jgi:hypothetical protein
MRTFLISLAVLGCGDSAPSADVACQAVAQARCNLRSTCSGGTRIARDYGDMNTCVVREKIACLNGLGAPSTGNSPSAVQSCARALPSESCSDFFLGNQPAPCIVTGKLAQGAVCAFNGQCGTTFCAIPRNVACGICQPEPSAGTSCATTGCGRGMECDAASMTCVVPGGLAASCNRETPCGPGLSCVGATTTTMGTCMAAGTTVGATCDPRQRTTPNCDGELGLYCNAVTLKCAALTYAAANAPCGTNASDGTEISCASGGACVGATATMLGSCQAPAADGGTCDTNAGPPCLAPARCITGGGTTTSGTCELNDAVMCQ